MKRLLLLAMTSLLSFTSILAQDYKVDLQEMFTKYSLVIEAKVISAESFRCGETDEYGRLGKIYTRYEIEIFEVFKNETSVNDLSTISLISYGGTLDGVTSTTNHIAGKMNIGHRFIGFFRQDNEQLHCLQESDFTNLSWKQVHGIYTEQETMTIYPPPFGRVTLKEYLGVLSEIVGRKLELPELRGQIDDPQECLEFLFSISTPDPLNLLVQNIRVSVRTTGESKHISKPVFGAKYDTDILGEYASSSNHITLEDVGISSQVNYESLIQDIAPDKIKIEVDAINLDQADLILITN